MNVHFDAADLKPLVQATVAEAIQAIAESPIAADERLAYPEAEAASLLGISPAQLRDARLRGEVAATKLGGRWGYAKAELLAYLARGQNQGNNP